MNVNDRRTATLSWKKHGGLGVTPEPTNFEQLDQFRESEALSRDANEYLRKAVEKAEDYVSLDNTPRDLNSTQGVVAVLRDGEEPREDSREFWARDVDERAFVVFDPRTDKVNSFQFEAEGVAVWGSSESWDYRESLSYEGGENPSLTWTYHKADKENESRILSWSRELAPNADGTATYTSTAVNKLWGDKA